VEREMSLIKITLFASFLFAIASVAFGEMATQDKSDSGKTEAKDRKAVSKSAKEEGQTPAQPVGTPPPRKESKAIEATAIFEQSGILTPRGKFVFEPSLQYANSSSNRVAVVGYTVIPSFIVGAIEVKEVEDNSLVAALGIRYGITNRFEAEVKVPYVYRSDSSSTVSEGAQVPDKVFSADGNDIGDVEFGVRYQINQPSGDGAYFIAGLRAKSNTGKDSFEVAIDPVTNLATELPTGSGFWAIQPSITAIYPSDPAVLFGSISYLYNVERNATIGGVKSRIDPGDIIGFNFGLGFALNERTSLSIGYDHSVVGRVKANGTPLPTSLVTQVGILLIGYSFKYGEKNSLSISLGAGLTESAPDVQLTLRVPMTL